MEFRILGPLEVTEDGRQLDVGTGKQRALLVVLLLGNGDVVSTDRLIEALWTDSPPASALNSVHIYVSRLRRALGDERVLTQGRGYRVVFGPGELDTHRFEQLVSKGREQRAAGDAEACVETLRSALELWRGPPLAEFAYEDFAQTEIARLDELHLAVLEERIDADLALGRHAELVPELEALVRDNPLREGLRAQLMLTLYRSGRQAEALERYQEGRRLLASELGLEPGPELKRLQAEILNQDPALDAPAAGAGREARLRRRPALALAAAGAAILAAAAALALAESRRGDAGLAAVTADAVGIVDPESGKITAQTPFAGEPVRLAAAGERIWVADDDAGTVSALDPRTNRLSSLVATGGFPSELALGEGALWVLDGKSGLLRKVDVVYGTITGSVRVTPPNRGYDASREGLDPVSVAAGLGSVWTTDGSTELVRVDPRTLRIVDRIDLGATLNGVAIGDSSVWAVSGQSATVFRVDRAGEVTATIEVVSGPDFDSPYPLTVRAGEGSVWVLNGNTATVTRVDPEQRTVLATIHIGIDRAPTRLAVGAGAVWVANGDGSLSRIDVETNDAETIAVGHRLRDVAVVDDAVLVTAGSGLSAEAGATYEGEAVKPLPASFCSPIYYGGGGQPQYLIASDLPLQGFGRTEIAQMSQAIQFVLRRRGFRAGPYSVAYQSCDDSTAADGEATPAKCEANAHEYAGDPSVIGIVGTWNSYCTVTELPILNSAPEGPLAMVSPANTLVGLTRGGAGTLPGEPDIYYPTGRRSYVRVVAADDLQGASNALLAKRLGVERLYLVDDGTGYGEAIASAVATAARRLGLRVVGPQFAAPGFEETLVVQISETRADAVFLGMGLFPASARLVRTLRAGLPAHVRILTPDGFSPPSKLVDAVGPAAEGITISTAGLPNSRLPAAGRAFVKEFGAAVGQEPYQWPASAAQAAEVLLDAIARSDGTRASVARELFRTKVEDGILGDFSIDQNGDTTAGAVTIYRIVRGAARLLDVITPSRRLVR